MKRCVIDPRARQHRFNNGYSYAITRLEQRGDMLYFERPFVNHPHIQEFRAYLVPAEGWQICQYVPHQGKHWCDWYVDICRITVEPEGWVMDDLFVDLGVHEGRGYDLLDTDELADALERGEISAADAAYALRSTQRLVEALAATGYAMQPLLAGLIAGSAAAEVASAGTGANVRLPAKGRGAVGLPVPRKRLR
jgi:predicted RNA-binding protein associated with RNAse of E/G family